VYFFLNYTRPSVLWNRFDGGGTQGTGQPGQVGDGLAEGGDVVGAFEPGHLVCGGAGDDPGLGDFDLEPCVADPVPDFLSQCVAAHLFGIVLSGAGDIAGHQNGRICPMVLAGRHRVGVDEDPIAPQVEFGGAVDVAGLPGPGLPGLRPCRGSSSARREAVGRRAVPGRSGYIGWWEQDL
jgi:hypothetical protein